MIGSLLAIRCLQKDIKVLQRMKRKERKEDTRLNIDKAIQKHITVINMLKGETEPFILTQQKHIQAAIKAYYYQADNWIDATSKGDLISVRYKNFAENDDIPDDKRIAKNDTYYRKTIESRCKEYYKDIS